MSNKQLLPNMEFSSLNELCKYINWDFDGTHPDRIKKKLCKYISFHNVGKSKIVIDDVYSDISDMIQISIKKKNTYLYDIDQILCTNSGEIQIIEQKLLKTKNNTFRAGYRCKCLVCGYEFEDYEYNITRGIGCGCCAGKIIVKGINDLWTTSPNIAMYLENPDDGYIYSKYSSKKVNFRCPVCGEILKNKTIRNVSIRGLSCACMRTKSIPNRMMYWTLRNLNIPFEDEKMFIWSNKKKYDFYIPSINTIVEMNGYYHYQLLSFKTTTLDQVNKNDTNKYNMAIDAGISHYISIECRSSNFNYIKNHIIQSDLSKLIPIDNVDWDYVKEKVFMSLIIEVSEKWNSGVKDIDTLAYHLGIKTKETVKKYLNLSKKYGYIKCA